MKLRQPMKFSENTFNILKNFSSINQSLLFSKGNCLRTISLGKNILAEAVINEELPKQFAIYDLNEFLNIIAIQDNPELDFSNESYVLIKDSNSHKAKYFFSDPNSIVTPPDKSMELPSKDICFNLTRSHLLQLTKASSACKLPDLTVMGDGAKINLVVRDRNNTTSHEYSIEVGTTDNTFMMNFKIENIRIIGGSYDVVISKKGIAEFLNTEMNIKYYIALEPDSTFE